MRYALLLTALLVTSASAQRLATDAEVARGLTACAVAIKARLKDPGSAQIATPLTGMLKDRQLFLNVKVNAKNSYGGYVGEEAWGCWLEEGTFAVAKLTAPGRGYVLGGR